MNVRKVLTHLYCCSRPAQEDLAHFDHICTCTTEIAEIAFRANNVRYKYSLHDMKSQVLFGILFLYLKPFEVL